MLPTSCNSQAPFQTDSSNSTEYGCSLAFFTGSACPHRAPTAHPVHSRRGCPGSGHSSACSAQPGLGSGHVSGGGGARRSSVLDGSSHCRHSTLPHSVPSNVLLSRGPLKIQLPQSLRKLAAPNPGIPISANTLKMILFTNFPTLLCCLPRENRIPVFVFSSTKPCLLHMG